MCGGVTSRGRGTHPGGWKASRPWYARGLADPGAERRGAMLGGVACRHTGRDNRACATRSRRGPPPWGPPVPEHRQTRQRNGFLANRLVSSRAYLRRQPPPIIGHQRPICLLPGSTGEDRCLFFAKSPLPNQHVAPFDPQTPPTSPSCYAFFFFFLTRRDEFAVRGSGVFHHFSFIYSAFVVYFGLVGCGCSRFTRITGGLFGDVRVAIEN